ncbi:MULTISPECIES: C40 family peptidase [unclassified Pseudomonas]|uniref:C40 family peptidase n=1 Tax=unclassified Pseudomonas TaxID=196821 RepID=UPI000BD0D813|nr:MULTISPECIES: C40 family peptidase [unclassified Pseudomonas]PVZ16360.1 cell wall-associated NlpC family hydrolase [Pseudomonas sp. URIL14HWK12:I12]PVZ25784.1 cell wall-associated NlpC family hydrolase [Pseudomonas sp. URIL14HWK12:I10]PVZ36692.1 cell wall-associated NlpC family hydrolase [Pseudomonas sp. URIL14HWK12:I11]SNZ12807.1 Cell wall-associated hydrolase, NlpC family [Pseudomonas sp. URIL14HWK12:I9]
MALFQARLALVACAAALLAACASPPSPPPVVQAAPPRPVIIDTSDYSAGRTDDVLFRAIGLVGTPYRWGGNTPDSGFDCSGLIDFVYRDAAGIALPRTTGEMLDMPKQSVNRSELRSGDLVFFSTQGGRRVSHAGIYVGEGRFVHAPRTGGTVRLDYLDKPYWAKAYLDAKRIIEPQRLANNP